MALARRAGRPLYLLVLTPRFAFALLKSDGSRLNSLAMSQSDILLWRWWHTDESGKRRETRYLLTEEDARARLKDPVKVPGSEQRFRLLGNTSDWQKPS